MASGFLMVVHSDGGEDPEAEQVEVRHVGDRVELSLPDGQILDFDRAELHEETAPAPGVRRAA